MIRFFRENKSTRDSVIGVVAVLFCISAIFGGFQSSKSSLSVGKRQVDTQRIHTQFQQIIKKHPTVDKQALEKDLISYALSSLKQFEYIENLGLAPTTKKIKHALSEILPKNASLKDLAKEQHLNQNQLLLSISDQIAFQQLTQSIESTSIITPQQQHLHEGVLTQIRTYIDIDLNQGVYPDNFEAYKAIYNQQNLQHSKVYHYNYVDITPETLNLPQITEVMISDYFLENLEIYADQDYEYQVTSYIPSTTAQSNHKPWPQHIQTSLDKFEENHPNSRMSTTAYHEKRSTLPVDHRIIEKMKPGQHYILDENNTFTVISLLQKQTSKTLDPNLANTLRSNLEKSQYTHLLQQKITELSEYAYTHPTSLEDFAKTHHLSLQTEQSNNMDSYSSLLNDEDFTEKHYISDSKQISELHYRYLQLIEIIPQKAKSYNEALDEIRNIYQQNILFPSILEQLNQANSIEDIKQICSSYKLSYQILNTEDKPVESIYALTPTRHNPHPSTSYQNHWQQLQNIHFSDRQEDIAPLIQKLDGEILLSTLRNATAQ